MLPRRLDLLVFRSNNAAHRPVLDALERVGRARASRRRVLHRREGVALDGVVPARWRPFLVGGEGQEARIGLVDYEGCVLKALRERLRAKEVGVADADRCRNPDEDLPTDFEARRDLCHADLGPPRDAAAFTAGLRAEMALRRLDVEPARNRDVGLRRQGLYRIRLSRAALAVSAAGADGVEGRGPPTLADDRADRRPQGRAQRTRSTPGRLRPSPPPGSGSCSTQRRCNAGGSYAFSGSAPTPG